MASNGIASRRISWQKADDTPALAAEQIHLWKIPLDGTKSTIADVGCLNALEIKRSQRLQQHTHQARFIAGRVAMRKILCRYANTTADKISFEFGVKGKPALANDNAGDISFNYTDANSIGLLAVAQNKDLGVDIEPVDRLIRFEKIAERKFSATEQQALSQLSQQHQRLGFLALWTRKEAYGKALGVGIHYRLSEHTLASDFSEQVYHLACSEDVDRHWIIQQLRIDDDHIASLVSPSPASTLSAFLYNPLFDPAA